MEIGALTYMRVVPDTLKLLDHLIPGRVAIPHNTTQDLLHCDQRGREGDSNGKLERGVCVARLSYVTSQCVR